MVGSYTSQLYQLLYLGDLPPYVVAAGLGKSFGKPSGAGIHLYLRTLPVAGEQLVVKQKDRKYWS